MDSHGLAGATVFVTGVAVMKSREADPPGGRKNSILSGTVPPTITVTITNCGASTALGSVMVTVPVYVPAASEPVWSAIETGMQLPLKEQECFAPMLGTSHGTDEDVCRLSEPSPRFPASTVWVSPFDPGTTATVNAVCVSASR